MKTEKKIPERSRSVLGRFYCNNFMLFAHESSRSCGPLLGLWAMSLHYFDHPAAKCLCCSMYCVCLFVCCYVTRSIVSMSRVINMCRVLPRVVASGNNKDVCIMLWAWNRYDWYGNGQFVAHRGHYGETPVNHLTPNGHYMGRTAQLTSRCCILYIYSTNIRIEYFTHAA